MENLLMELIDRQRPLVNEIIETKRLKFAERNPYIKMDDAT